MKARHPWPVTGWREGPTEQEWENWRQLLVKYRKWKPRRNNLLGMDWKWRGSPGYGYGDPSILDLGRVLESQTSDYVIVGSRLFATSRWILSHLVKPGWSIQGMTGFIVGKGIDQLPKCGWQNYHDVEQFIIRCVADTSHHRKRIKPYVARLIHWSWSIEQKLEAILAQSE